MAGDIRSLMRMPPIQVANSVFQDISPDSSIRQISTMPMFLECEFIGGQ